MKRLSVIFSPTVIVLGLGLMSFSLTSTVAYYGGQAVTKIWKPELFCASTTHDFGTIDRTERPEYTFVIENKGNSDLLIKSVVAGCGSCVRVVEYTESPIRPGHRGSVALELLAQNLFDKVSKDILVMTNDSKQPILTLTLEAEITP